MDRISDRTVFNELRNNKLYLIVHPSSRATIVASKIFGISLYLKEGMDNVNEDNTYYYSRYNR